MKGRKTHGREFTAEGTIRYERMKLQSINQTSFSSRTTSPQLTKLYHTCKRILISPDSSIEANPLEVRVSAVTYVHPRAHLIGFSSSAKSDVHG